MEKINLGKNINYLSELADDSIEKEFLQHSFDKSVKYVEAFLLLVGIINILFLIPDYFFVNSTYSFTYICIGRIVFSFLDFLLLDLIYYIKSFKTLSYWITAYEGLYFILFIFVYYEYRFPHYIIQSMGIMTIVLFIFIISNRWINKVCLSIIFIAVFNIISVNFIDNIDLTELSAVVVYSIIISAVAGIASYGDNCYKRIQYITSKELERLSVTDTLTGACNRAKFNNEFIRFIDYFQRYNSPLTILMIDFDDFKKINDKYGHLAGDDALIQFVKIINDDIREIDMLARWGGEEFVVLLPNTNIEQAMIIAERIRIKVENHNFEIVNKITCSIGVAQLSDEDNANSLMQKADKMLYKAKVIGKNVVAGYGVD